MDGHSNQLKTINVGEHSLLIGSQWQTESKLKGVLFSLALRSRAQSAGMHYAASFSADPKGALQYALISPTGGEKQLYSADMIVAKNAAQWAPKDDNSLTVFVKSIPVENNDFSSAYWICAVNLDGTLLSGGKHIAENDAELVEMLNLLSLTYDQFTFLSVDRDYPLQSFFAENEHRLSISGTAPHHHITEDEFEMAVKKGLDDAAFRQVYKPSRLKPKKIGLSIGITAAIILGLTGRSYLAQSDSIEYFEKSGSYQAVSSDKSSYEKKMNEIKLSAKKWDDRTFRKVTLDQFVADLQSNQFSPMDVTAVLYEINRSMPMFAAEWQLTEIVYDHNRFFCRYERIEGGKGVYFLLDQFISQINNPHFKITPNSLTAQGEARTFEITPNITLPRAELLSTMGNSLRDESKSDTQLSRQLKKGADAASSILSIHDQYNTMDFKQRWVFNEGVGLLEQAMTAESSLSNAKKAIQNVQVERKKLTPLVLDNNLIIGNVMDFISMMQIDSFFEWSYPALIRTYPDESALSERNKEAIKADRASDKKKKKDKKDNGFEDETQNKKKKSLPIYGAAIESYKVEIKTLPSAEEEKTKSYGIADMLQLGLLIDKPFVNVDRVEYDKRTEQWSFHIHFHRKTPEYAKRFEKK